MGYGYTFRDGDWAHLRQIIQKLSSITLGPESIPTFSDIYLSDLAGTFNQLIYADTDGLLTAENDLTNWIAGTANQITVTDDTDGTVTLSIPDVLIVGTSGQFGNLTCTSGSITDTSGAISFGNEDLTTTGLGTFNELLLTSSSVDDYLFTSATSGAFTNRFAITSTASGQQFHWNMFTNDGVGTDGLFLHLIAKGTISSATTTEFLQIGYAAAPLQFVFRTQASGAGSTVRPLRIEAGANTNQIYLDIDGDVGINTSTPAYALDVQGQIYTSSAVFYGSALNVIYNSGGDLHIAANTKIVLDDDTLLYSTSKLEFNDANTYFVYSSGDLDLYLAANKTLELQTVVYKDINLTGAVFSLPAASAPTETQLLDEAGAATGIYSYGFGVGDKVSGSFELQHDYKEGTNLTFHVHWYGISAPAGGTDNVQWQLDYTVAQDSATLDAATTLTVETAYTTQYEWVRSDFTAITGTNYNIGDQFMFTLSRISASADEYGDDAVVATVGVHYQVNTLGSRQIGTK